MIRKSNKGAIFNVGSTSAVKGQPFISAYYSSKAALVTFIQKTALALMRNRIQVNQLNIGWISSEGEGRTQRIYQGAKMTGLRKPKRRNLFAV